MDIDIESRSNMVSLPVAKCTMAAQQAVPQAVPMAPFTAETPFGNGVKLQCFFEGCTLCCVTYASMMTHICKSHKPAKAANFKGTDESEKEVRPPKMKQI